MSNIWVSSDWHYGHRNMVKGISQWEDTKGCRNFNTLEEHNETLIKNINSCAKYNDLMFFLGDFAFGETENIYKFWSRLECHNIIFLLGNHDIKIAKNIDIKIPTGIIPVQSLFKEVYDICERRIGDDFFVFCHYPFYSYHKMHKGAIHGYGHTHKELNYNKQAVCTSIECHPEFRPFHIEELKQIVKNKN